MQWSWRFLDCHTCSVMFKSCMEIGFLLCPSNAQNRNLQLRVAELDCLVSGGASGVVGGVLAALRGVRMRLRPVEMRLALTPFDGDIRLTS